MKLFIRGQKFDLWQKSQILKVDKGEKEQHGLSDYGNF